MKVNQVKTRVMLIKIWQITVKRSSKKDPCVICDGKAVANAVLCKSCGNWICEKFAKIKRVTNILAIDFKCRKCKGCR